MPVITKEKRKEIEEKGGIVFHEFQTKAMLSQARFLGLISGIQGGKTTLGSFKMASWVSQRPGLYVICAPTNKKLDQSTLVTFRHYNSLYHWGEYREQKRQFLWRNGSVSYIRSMEDDWAIEGIPDCQGVWADEGGQMGFPAWLAFQGRTNISKGNILITTTPYAMNWLYHDFYSKWKKRDPLYEVFQFPSYINPKFPKDEYDRMKGQLEEKLFAMRYEGEFRKMVGLVFPEWSPVPEIPKPEEIKKLVAGVDFGYPSPSAIVLPGITKSGQGYILETFKKAFTQPDRLALEAKKMEERWKTKIKFYCDPSSPEKIQVLREKKLDAVAADNRKGLGLQTMEIGLRTKKFLIYDKLSDFRDELETFSYPQDKPNEDPDDRKFHLMAAGRYALLSFEVPEHASRLGQAEADWYQARASRRLWA